MTNKSSAIIQLCDCHEYKINEQNTPKGITGQVIQVIHDLCCLFAQALDQQMSSTFRYNDDEVFSKMIAILNVDKQLITNYRFIQSKKDRDDSSIFNYAIRILVNSRAVDACAYRTSEMDNLSEWKNDILSSLDNDSFDIDKFTDIVCNGSYVFFRITDDMMIRNIALNPVPATFKQLWAQLCLYSKVNNNILWIHGTGDHDKYVNKEVIRQYNYLIADYVKASINNTGKVIDSFGDIMMEL